MDLSFITNYFVPVVMAGCLATGYVVKKWIKDVDNKYIPTIVFALGAILNCIVMKNITVETVVGGLFVFGIHWTSSSFYSLD